MAKTRRSRRRRGELKECGICLEKINLTNTGNNENGKKFGLLSNCDHLFCYSCIHTWRESNEFGPEVGKRCPECRITSQFVAPSFQYLTGDKKLKRIRNFQENQNKHRNRTQSNRQSTNQGGYSTTYQNAQQNTNRTYTNQQATYWNTQQQNTDQSRAQSHRPSTNQGSYTTTYQNAQQNTNRAYTNQQATYTTYPRTVYTTRNYYDDDYGYDYNDYGHSSSYDYTYRTTNPARSTSSNNASNSGYSLTTWATIAGFATLGYWMLKKCLCF